MHKLLDIVWHNAVESLVEHLSIRVRVRIRVSVRVWVRFWVCHDMFRTRSSMLDRLRK